MNRNLAQFYVAFSEWIDSGCAEHPVFETDVGLCRNYNWWLTENRRGYSSFRLLEKQFENAGLNIDYPFGEKTYYNTPHYKCPKRLAWIKHHAVIAKEMLNENQNQ